MFECGIVSVSFRDLSAESIMKITKAAGLSCIEWGSDVHAPANDEQRLRWLVKTQSSIGLRSSSYGTYFRLGVNDISELPEYIKAAKTLGTQVLRIWCSDKGYGSTSAEQRSKIRSEAKKAALMARSANVVICLECHNGTYTDTPEGALDIMEAADSESFRMYWQPNQFRSFQENLFYAESIAPYTKNIHVFNWNGKLRLPLSSAAELWREYLYRFDGTQKLLLEFMPDGSAQSLAREAESLREIVRGVV